jgi:hypothetical protein
MLIDYLVYAAPGLPAAVTEVKGASACGDLQFCAA